MMWAGAGTIASTAIALFFKLPEATVDLTPWIHWKIPTALNEDFSDDNLGQILVTVEYDVASEQETSFLRAIRKYERIRRRDGAYRWGIFRDLEHSNRYLETFLVDSWAEHLRQHQRSTAADREVTERVQSFIRGTPMVRHLAYPTLKR
jgi:hypothetical protein